jgi:lysophospholipase L1-like esterase
MFKNFKNGYIWLAVTLLNVLVVMLAFELAGHVSFRLIKGRFVWQAWPEIGVYQEHPYLSAMLAKNKTTECYGEQKNVTVGKYGRITENVSEEDRFPGMRVVCLGGSTTFGNGVGDSDTWPFILQQRLGRMYRVFNLGVPGYSTAEAIIQMLLIVPDLRPDIVIQYHGWNDLRNYHNPQKSSDYFWHGMSQKRNLLILTSTERFFYKYSATWNFVLFIRKTILSRKAQAGQPAAGGPFVSGDPDPFVDSLYVRNVKALDDLAGRLSMRLIFVPQIINVSNFRDHGKSRPWTPYVDDASMPALIRHMNSLLSQIRQDGNTFVANDVLRFPWPNDCFVDDGHFSRKGAERFVEALMPAILKCAEQSGPRTGGIPPDSEAGGIGPEESWKRTN